MPRGDRTGPDGLGPMTGRAAGYCAGYSVPGFANQAFGRMGLGRGTGRFGGGRGRGLRNRYWATRIPAGGMNYYDAYAPANNYVPPVITASQEAELLKNQAKILQDNLAEINTRLQSLEDQAKEEKSKK